LVINVMKPTLGLNKSLRRFTQATEFKKRENYKPNNYVYEAIAATLITLHSQI
jgi:hypothetical protein